jgi:hypothetical protein
MAAALPPHFKLGVVGYLNMEMEANIKRAIVNEIKHRFIDVDHLKKI